MLAVGFDIIQVKRFSRFLDRRDQRSWTSAFSIEELSYSYSKSQPELHLAVRFAAKEALVKAAATLGYSIDYNKVFTAHIGTKTAPIVRCIQESLSSYTIQASLTHTTETAAAIVILSKK